MPFTPRIDLVTLLTDKFDPMLAFYRDVVGFDVSMQHDQFVEFKSTGVRFAICARAVMAAATEHESYGQQRVGQPFELAFPVDSADDVDDVFNMLVERGAEAVRAPKSMPWGQRTAFFGDPDGNIHEVFADIQ